MNAWKIENAKNALGESQEVLINEGVIVQSLPTGSKPTVINAEGLYVFPGFVDLHTHLREPGREDAETVLTGSQAAVAGGFTAISAMPNTLPVADTAGVVEQVFHKLALNHIPSQCFSIDLQYTTFPRTHTNPSPFPLIPSL